MQIVVIRAEAFTLEVDAVVFPARGASFLAPHTSAAGAAEAQAAPADSSAVVPSPSFQPPDDPVFARPSRPLERLLERGGSALLDAFRVLPLPSVGESRLLPPGELPCRHVIHAPLYEHEGMPYPVDDLKRGILAALRCAEDQKVRTLAFPELITGDDERQNVRAARAMVAVLSSIEPAHLSRVLLVTSELGAVKRLEEAVAAICE